MVIAQGKSRQELPLPKKLFNRKMSLLTSRLNIELKKKLIGIMFEALLYMAQRPEY